MTPAALALSFLQSISSEMSEVDSYMSKAIEIFTNQTDAERLEQIEEEEYPQDV